jgi:hypothetical protein
MKPISFSDHEKMMQGGSPDIAELPVLTSINTAGLPEVISCWKLSWRERLFVLFKGKVFVHLLTYRHPPLFVSTQEGHIRTIEKGYEALNKEGKSEASNG